MFKCCVMNCMVVWIDVKKVFWVVLEGLLIFCVMIEERNWWLEVVFGVDYWCFGEGVLVGRVVVVVVEFVFLVLVFEVDFEGVFVGDVVYYLGVEVCFGFGWVVEFVFVFVGDVVEEVFEGEVCV